MQRERQRQRQRQRETERDTERERERERETETERHNFTTVTFKKLTVFLLSRTNFATSASSSILIHL